MTREIVQSYGGVCALLAERRNVEQKLNAIRRQIDHLMTGGGPSGYGRGPSIEKVRGEAAFVFTPRGTNNPEAAREQHEDGYREALSRQMQRYEQVLIDAEDLIGSVLDGTDQAILRYYYCCRMSDERIAPLVGYARSNVSKRRSAVIFELELRFGRKVAASGG